MQLGFSHFRSKASPVGLLFVTLLAGTGMSSQTKAVQSVTLTWDASPDTNAVGYVLYYGTASGEYNFRFDVGTSEAVTVTNLTEGQTYYFAVTAYDAEGMESEPSNEVRFVVPGILTLTFDPITGVARIRFPAPMNRACEVLSSSNLISWQSLMTTTSPVNGWVEVRDLAMPPPPTRFYQLQFLHQ